VGREAATTPTASSTTPSLRRSTWLDVDVTAITLIDQAECYLTELVTNARATGCLSY